MRPKVICLTPVKNEEWILDKFLKATSLWADHIIIADQNSDDGSVDIAGRFDKVILVRNEGQDYSEEHRSKMLIDAARKIPGPRLLIALDADEFLTPNFHESPEWDRMLSAREGTKFLPKRVSVSPDLRNYWVEGPAFMGYMDDGIKHRGTLIHSPRLPSSPQSPGMPMNEIMIIHLQYTDWQRMHSKHMWYLCWEKLNRPYRSPVEVYRQYHHMYAVSPERLIEVPDWWYEKYAKHGINLSQINIEGTYWWDRETLKYFEDYGTGHFSSDAVWDVDWVEKAKILGFDEPERFADPRSKFERDAHNWLARTQPDYKKMRQKLLDKIYAMRWWLNDRRN